MLHLTSNNDSLLLTIKRANGLMETLEPSASGLKYKQLQEFENEINWQKLVKLIAHDYVVSGIGRLLIPVECMIRIYFLQLRYNLSAQEATLALSKIDILRNFALIDLKTDLIPEEATINDFAILVDKRSLKTIFQDIFNIKVIFKK